MPPRPPPTPPVLTVLCSLAALIVVWAALAIDQLARAGVASLAGAPAPVFHLSAGHYFTLQARQSPVALGAWGTALMALAGPVSIVALGLLLGLITGFMRPRGLLRGLSLAWIVVALLWLPLGFLAAALPGGGGPVAELYLRLGAPQAGRWTAAALGLLLVVLVAGPISRRAIQDGRGWMRVDGVAFRRRLVRVTAGWPGALAAAALAFAAGWAPSAWAAGLLAAVMGSLHFRTS